MSLAARTIATKGDGKLIGSTHGSNEELPHHQSGLSSTLKPLASSHRARKQSSLSLAEPTVFSGRSFVRSPLPRDVSMSLLDRATTPSSDDSGRV
jgi:hypothetical protein